VWTPFQTHYYSENLVAPGIEPGTSVSLARNSDHQTTEAVTDNLTDTKIKCNTVIKMSHQIKVRTSIEEKLKFRFSIKEVTNV
jgi:putative aminopeptidase FrvX